MKHYLHISASMSYNYGHSKVSWDGLYIWEEGSISDLRKYIKPDDHILKDIQVGEDELPVIESMTEISQELYEILMRENKDDYATKRHEDQIEKIYLWLDKKAGSYIFQTEEDDFPWLDTKALIKDLREVIEREF